MVKSVAHLSIASTRSLFRWKWIRLKYFETVTFFRSNHYITLCTDKYTQLSQHKIEFFLRLRKTDTFFRNSIFRSFGLISRWSINSFSNTRIRALFYPGRNYWRIMYNFGGVHIFHSDRTLCGNSQQHRACTNSETASGFYSGANYMTVISCSRVHINTVYMCVICVQ